MIDPFETPLNDFHQELHRIYGLAKIIDDLREFGRVTPHMHPLTMNFSSKSEILGNIYVSAIQRFLFYQPLWLCI